jgi:cytidylate kinase
MIIITIDGPAAAGKGTLSGKLAEILDFDFLDTGLLYRAVACHLYRQGFPFDNKVQAIWAAKSLIPEHLKDPDLRLEHISQGASIVSAMPYVRKVLLDFQQDYPLRLTKKGLVADGRDLGTVVFPEAVAKIFVTATPEVRAQRRLKELHDKGIEVVYDDVLLALLDRDERDRTREDAPMCPSLDGLILDTSDLNPAEVLRKALAFVEPKLKHFYQKGSSPIKMP